MIWSNKLEKKWVDLALIKGVFGKTHFINKCVLIARSNDNKALGFVVVEPRDFQENFVNKIKKRFLDSSTQISKFDLYLPRFLEHRSSQIIDSETLDFVNIQFTSFVELSYENKTLSTRSKIKVINVDDSPVILKFLKHTLECFDHFEVTEQVQDPKNAVDTICKYKPDLVTLDIQMPGMTGVDVLKNLLAKEHFPVLMVSSLSLDEGSLVFEALNAGAFDYLQKPQLDDKNEFSESINERLLLAIEGRDAHSSIKKRTSKLNNQKRPDAPSYNANLVWALGSSTGGTQALTHVFTSLPAHIPPTLIVQHIPPVFSKAFANSLDALCPFTVKEAEDGDLLRADHAYVAPGGKQMKLLKTKDGFRISITDDAPVNRFKPSVDYLFNNLSELKGISFVAGIFTGMGKDGANGLLALKKSGAQTFAQDEASSAVYGMPRAAVEIGAADTVCPLEEAAQTLVNKSILSARKAA